MAQFSTASDSSKKDTDNINGDRNNKKGEEEEGNMFECNICLDIAKDAVISMCGHLFCWPCLHQWLETRPNRQVCPVCKAGIGRDKVIPVYGRGGKKKDPRDKIPPRPQGQRPEAETNSFFPGFGFGDGPFHLSFGIGAFPFGFITNTFHANANAQPEAQNAATLGGMSAEDESFLNKLFLFVAFVFFFWLFYA